MSSIVLLLSIFALPLSWAFSIFSEYPALAILLGFLLYSLAIVGLERYPENKFATAPVFLPSMAWILYGLYEHYLIVEPGRYSIRIDLLVIYPVLALITIFPIMLAVSAFRHSERESPLARAIRLKKTDLHTATGAWEMILFLPILIGGTTLFFFWNHRWHRHAHPHPGAVVAKPVIDWVTIPGGTFMMGCADKERAGCEPPHRVEIRSFQIARTLITNKQYHACVEAGICKEPRDLKSPEFLGDTQPIVRIDWEDAKAFSEWVGGRLPSDAEWEYAARSAGKDWRYPWGNTGANCERAAVLGCGLNGTLPVCSRPKGNTQQGLCDMAGNVWEWVEDCSRPPNELTAPSDGSAFEDPHCKNRVLRGGSVANPSTDARSSGERSMEEPDWSTLYLGFRPAKSI